jgi:hypothetical protein
MANQQVDEMANILSKMNSAASGKRVATSSSQDETNAMADVLRKLHAATNDAAKDLVTESKTNHDLDMAVKTRRTETGVSVSRFDIRTERKTVQEGLTKTFYSVIDNKTNNVIYDNLGLFESAMGIVKHKLYKTDEQKVQRILDLDQEYVGAVMETYRYKKKLTRLTESSVQHDVTSAKYSNARSKVGTVKMRLLKAL